MQDEDARPFCLLKVFVIYKIYVGNPSVQCIQWLNYSKAILQKQVQKISSKWNRFFFKYLRLKC